MKCVLSADKTILIDKLIKTTKSELLNIEIDNHIEIYLNSSDLSQLTIIKLEQSFFEFFENSKFHQIAFPTKKFYEPNMKTLEIILEDNKMILEYQFSNMKYIKTFDCLESVIFDIEFENEKEINIELYGFRNILKDIKDKQLKIEMKDSLKISGHGVEILLPETDLNVEFKIDTERFKSFVFIADYFYTTKFIFSTENSPLNITMESPEVFLTTFISVE